MIDKWFGILPNKILFNKKLSDKQKLLFVYITSLCAEKGYCWASNKYISENMWCSENTISVNISKLKELWFIEVNIIQSSWNQRKILISENEQGGLLKNQKRSFEKSKEGSFEKSKDNNIIYNNINNNILLSNDNNSEAEIIKDEEVNSLSIVDDSKEKEKSSAKKEKESYGREDINYLIEQIKLECNNLWVMYDKTKEREFAKHILTAKEFWENAKKCWMNRVNFALNILLASIKIKYWKWYCNWPMKIYQNYIDVYNQTIMKKNSWGWIVHIS